MCVRLPVTQDRPAKQGGASLSRQCPKTTSATDGELCRNKITEQRQTWLIEC